MKGFKWSLTFVFLSFALVQSLLFPIQSLAMSDLTASIPKKGIYLFAKRDAAHYYDFLLQINKQYIHFPIWQNVKDPEFRPKLYYLDMNNDFKKELVVILTVTHEKDVQDQKVHVLCKLNGLYQEINVEKPDKILSEHVTVNLYENKLLVNVDGQTQTLDISEYTKASEEESRNLIIDSQIKYEIENNQLAAFARLSIAPAKPIGKLKITYKISGEKAVKNKVDLLLN